jgi:hypothetical protein
MPCCLALIHVYTPFVLRLIHIILLPIFKRIILCASTALFTSKCRTNSCSFLNQAFHIRATDFREWYVLWSTVKATDLAKKLCWREFGLNVRCLLAKNALFPITEYCKLYLTCTPARLASVRRETYTWLILKLYLISLLSTPYLLLWNSQSTPMQTTVGLHMPFSLLGWA